MLSKFTIEGEVINYAPDVKYVRGVFPHDQTSLTGQYYLRSKEGKVYIGDMKDSKKEGAGVLMLESGHVMIGKWNSSTFKGVFKSPNKH